VIGTSRFILILCAYNIHICWLKLDFAIVSAARALGRGGSSVSNLKRYDIGPVFHRSMAEGHPREALEATFDVIQEDVTKGFLSEAETIFVICQVMAQLPRRKSSWFNFEARTPLWILRINNTRLAECILDLCGVPHKEDCRCAALRVLSRFTAPSPSSLSKFLVTSKKKSGGRRRSFDDADQSRTLVAFLDEAISKYSLPKPAADRLRTFVESCMPLPCDFDKSIDQLKVAVTKLRGMESTGLDPRRIKRFEDAAKSLRSLKDLFSTLHSLHLDPLISSTKPSDENLSQPLYVSLDLGLRQRRRHFHGGLIYQCIALPDAFFDQADLEHHNDALISSSGRGIKVAEGGNYSELVRKHRPPGNFATAFVNYYTAAPIPVCAGVRISVGKMVELVYLEASCTQNNNERWNELAQRSAFDSQSIELVRHSLGHPLQYSETVHCLVVSVHGMDAGSIKERFLVASRLWSEGVSAEYLPQSGVILSLLKPQSNESSDPSESSDWSLTDIFGICALLNIPFVVIVSAHLLKDKGLVRLRRYPFDIVHQGQSTGSSGSNEIVVSLDDLAATILGASEFLDEDAEEQMEAAGAMIPSSRDHHRPHKETQRVECIYVDQDQYFGNDQTISKSETPQWKAYLKTMKSITMSAESYLVSLQDSKSLASAGMQGLPVFAVADATFWVLRDFGTELMRRERADKSAIGATNEIIERHPKYKRTIKTLGIAIDSYMKRHGIWGGGQQQQGGNHHRRGEHRTSSLMTILLYSKVDDRFDMVTLSCIGGGTNGRGGGISSASSRRR